MTAQRLGSTAAYGPADYEVITYFENGQRYAFARAETIKDEQSAHAAFFRSQTEAAAQMTREWARGHVVLNRCSPIGLKTEVDVWHSTGQAA